MHCIISIVFNKTSGNFTRNWFNCRPLMTTLLRFLRCYVFNLRNWKIEYHKYYHLAWYCCHSSTSQLSFCPNTNVLNCVIAQIKSDEWCHCDISKYLARSRCYTNFDSLLKLRLANIPKINSCKYTRKLPPFFCLLHLW